MLYLHVYLIINRASLYDYNCNCNNKCRLHPMVCINHGPKTVKKLLQSVYICGSHRKIKTGVPLFGPPGNYNHNHNQQ